MTAPFTPAVQSLPVFEYFRIYNDPIAAQALPPALLGGKYVRSKLYQTIGG